jgi:diguanylate cyclase (GGDEF)-like protein
VSPAALFELAIVGGSLACGAGGAIIALRARAAARADRLALRLRRAHEESFIEAARRLGEAGRAGAGAVRDEIARAARALAPQLDAVLLYEEHEGVLRCVYASGERVAYFAGSRIALDDERTLPVRALAAGHRVTLEEPGTAALHPHDRAALAVPLALEGGRSCVLVASARVGLDAGAVERLVRLAEHAAPAYLTALEREDDRRRAEYDGLTGLLTPRAFRTRLGALVERARVTPTARLALLFVDTDRFKDWNDSYGHASGDALLRELARLLRAAVRQPEDLVARNGGDEFCVVFTETEKSTAIERAEALRERIAAADFAPLRGSATHAVRITASIGVAAHPADARSANELLERADEAMYHSKRTGRDGVSYVGVDGAMTRLDAALV